MGITNDQLWFEIGHLSSEVIFAAIIVSLIIIVIWFDLRGRLNNLNKSIKKLNGK